MNRYRKALAVSFMLLGTAAIVWAQARPDIEEKFVRTGTYFVRQPDTTCACISDTTTGPSVYCFGARRIIWRIQANSGTCSTLTVQVSNNDTTYISMPGLFVAAHHNFVVGDSLNTGNGVMVAVYPVDSVRTNAAVGFPYRFSRVVARQRAGVTSNNDCTILCRAKVDSLRWKAAIVWSAP